MEIKRTEKRTFDPWEINALAREFEDATAQEILKWAINNLGEKLVLVTSFQDTGMVVIDLATQINPEIRVVTVDSGRLHDETYSFIETVQKHYNLNLEVVSPDSWDVEKMVREHGMNLFYTNIVNRRLCCNVRKVEPLKKALKSADGWLSGLRRDQSESRSDAAKIEIDYQYGGIVKINPLADWDESMVQKYLAENNVPRHPLYAQGFRSIGCSPCTRPIQINENSRAGRWWWESDEMKECGIHFKNAG